MPKKFVRTKKINKKKLPEIKKNIKDFLLSEEGKIQKQDVVKLGISLTILAMMLEPHKAYATHASATDGAHSSDFIGGQHNSFQPHNSTHTNHTNHGAGGWC